MDFFPVCVRCGDQEVETYALLGIGSDKTYCEIRLLDKFNVPIDSDPVHLKLESINGSREVDIIKISLSVLPWTEEKSIAYLK